MTKQWLHIIDEAVKYIQNNDIELGLAALEKVQTHGKNLPEVMLYLAEVWYELGHLERAKQILFPILQNPSADDQELLEECELLLAEIALEEERYDIAEPLLYGMMERGCPNPRLPLLLADLYIMQGLHEVAVKYLEKAHELQPDEDEIKEALRDLYASTGRMEDALRISGSLKVKNVGALMWEANLRAHRGEFEAAYQLYTEVVQKERHPDAFYAAGMLAFQMGRPEEAVHFLEALLAMEEEYVTAYPVLADSYLSIGKTEEAIRALKTYVNLSGFELHVIKRLIDLLHQSGRYDEAKEYEELYRNWNVDDERDL